MSARVVQALEEEQDAGNVEAADISPVVCHTRGVVDTTTKTSHVITAMEEDTRCATSVEGERQDAD